MLQTFKYNDGSQLRSVMYSGVFSDKMRNCVEYGHPNLVLAEKINHSF